MNNAGYGSEKVYNASRLAMKLQQEHAGAQIRVFLMADAVTAALPAQSGPLAVTTAGLAPAGQRNPCLARQLIPV